MSENERQARLPAFFERAEQRFAEFSPQLDVVRAQAIQTYEILRPKARHIAGAPDDARLLHQQVYGSLGGEAVADYLIIRLGEHHTLNLYHNLDHSSGKETEWEFTRHKGAEPLLTEKTEIKTFPFRIPDLHLEVSTYRYTEHWGRNPQHVAFICSPFNDYEAAEGYIALFAADLEAALTQFAD